jgi:tripartite-type tricarboxylate transporter receptor subunit TctC
LSEANPTANLGSKWLLAMMSPNLLVEERRGRDGYRCAQPTLRDEFSGSFCRLIRCGIVAALAAAVTTQPARSAGVEDFYKGKTVSLLIGYSVGGGYDAYGRLLARHLGKHIPGSPSVVPQNMTGAGSLKAANYVYSVAPKDGSVIGTFSRSMGIAPLLDKAEFDSTKFTWLGSVTDEVSLCVTRHDAPVKSFSELLVTPATFGAEGAGSDPNIFASFYRNVLGAKIKVVTGYPGTNEIQLAVERGEVDGLCGLSWSTLKGRYPHWLKEKRANILVQAGIKKQPELPDVPSASDLAKATDQTQILRLLLIGQAMARPFAAPPGIPADRRAALIAAFERTTADPDFLAEGERLNFEVNPVSANQLDALLAEAYATPKDVIAKAAKAMSE